MSWEELQIITPYTHCATLYCYRQLFENVFAIPSSVQRDMFSSAAVGLSPAVCQSIAASALDAANIPEIKDTMKAARVIDLAEKFVNYVCAAIYLARNGTDPQLESKLEAEVRVNDQSLKDTLGHDNSKQYRTALYRAIEAVLPEDDLKAATISKVLSALRMNADALKRNPNIGAFHNTGISEADTLDYRQAFLRLVEALGIYALCSKQAVPDFAQYASMLGVQGIGQGIMIVGSQMSGFDQDILERLLGPDADIISLSKRVFDSYTRVWMHNVNAGQDPSFWDGEESRVAFGSVYLPLVRLIYYGAEIPSIDWGFDEGLSPEKNQAMEGDIASYKQVECTMSEGNLAEAAYAYWKLMPNMTPDIMANNLATRVSEDSGVQPFWEKPEDVTAYIANLLSPYMREAPLMVRSTTFPTNTQ